MKTINTNINIKNIILILLFAGFILNSIVYNSIIKKLEMQLQETSDSIFTYQYQLKANEVRYEEDYAILKNQYEECVINGGGDTILMNDLLNK